MPHPRISGEEIDRRGQEWYDNTIRRVVETEENIGKIISIDVETGDYSIGNDPLETGQAMLAKHPGAALLGLRIGYNAVYSLGGTLKRTAP